MNVTCIPSALRGEIPAIPSKSDAHRKLICAALSENGGYLPLRAPHCEDILATMRCLSALGADFLQIEQGLQVVPVHRQSTAALDCGESGSTLRFLLPVAMCICPQISVTGSGRLPERPISTLTAAMSAHGVHFHSEKLPLSAEGQLHGGLYEIEGNISSQFLSGLLMALPLCEEDSEIHLTTALQSAPYVAMTMDTLRLFGIHVTEQLENGFLCYQISGKQRYQMPQSMEVDGDWSNAAFWLTAGAMLRHSSLTVTGLSMDSIQGDKAICAILRHSGASISVEGNAYSVHCERLDTLDVSMKEIPDLLPILAVRAAFATGDSHFTQAERLRLKESDRLKATAELLIALGGRVTELEDGLIVHGGGLRGGTVDGKNDHRLVMAAAIAAQFCPEPVTILGAEAVNKSYPQFFADLSELGGVIHGIELR